MFVFLAPPETPLSVKVVGGCTNYKPTITWIVGEANQDTMKYVEVEYTSEYPDDANTWYVAGKSFGESANQFEFGTTDNPLVLPGNAAIKFRATAYNQVGASGPSLTTKFIDCRTPPKRKFAAFLFIHKHCTTMNQLFVLVLLVKHCNL